MLDTVLRLQFLDSDSCVFMGDATETVEHHDVFGGKHEHENRYPALQLSREMWESYGNPTVIRVSVTNMSHEQL